MSPSQYVSHVDLRLRQEEQRCDRFFERQSKREVMEIAQRKLIAEQAGVIVERGFKDMAKGNEVENLRTLYRLLALVKNLDVLRIAWTDYIKVLTFEALSC